VWQVPNLNPIGGTGEEATGHGTQKSVELMRRAILNNSVSGDIVYDPFLGSGTTLVAAEKTDRVCYGIDIDPRYVDVIIRRWQQLTGKQAILAGDQPELRGNHSGASAACRTSVVMARPSLNPTEDQRRMVKSMAAVGTHHEGIALKIGCTAEDPTLTFQKRVGLRRHRGQLHGRPDSIQDGDLEGDDRATDQTAYNDEQENIND
jgi:hypothetical protein